MRTLELIVINQSCNLGNVILYQRHPNMRDPSVRLLAWLAKPAYPGTQVSFRWQEVYNFAWSEAGALGSGIVFEASQSWPANSDNNLTNTVRLTYANGAFKFVPSRLPGQEGSLLLEQDDTIPLRRASIGIGSHGQSVLALPAQPNVNLLFKPQPVYYLAFGWHKSGEVLDVEEVTYPPRELSFPFNVDSLKATLTERNTWQIEPDMKVS